MTGGYMTEYQKVWVGSRDRLIEAVATVGLPAEFAEVMAKQLKSPKAIDRMTSYIYQAHPTSVEMVVDEMLAICSDIDAWHEKKANQEAQAKYNAYLYYRRMDDEE